VRLSEQRAGLGVADPAEGRLTTLARPDIERYAAQLDYPVHPFYLQMTSQDPPPVDYPVMVALPAPGDGPHLGYAVQWFIFTAIAVALADLDDAVGPADVDLPGYRLHPLKGALDGFWSITVSANWRMTFRFESGDAHDVDLVDYHGQEPRACR